MGVVNVLEAVRHTPSVRAVVVVTSDRCYDTISIAGFSRAIHSAGTIRTAARKARRRSRPRAMRRSFFDVAGTAAIAPARAGNVIGGGDCGSASNHP